mmetsp:Transcript_71668/g.113592  ORF Transcript_71668/g.113592 Transcript_71668/m.113592 type:complete len:246 (-) Transcript_71668:654-1391(-)
MAEGPLSALFFSLFFTSVPPFPLPLPACGLMKSASLKCREEALSSSDIRDVLPLPFASFPPFPFPELSPFLPPFGLGGTAAGGICVGSGEAFTLGLAIETSLRALEFPLTSTQSCRSCASNMGLLFSGWRKGEMAADLGDDLEEIAGEAYFDAAAICGETETLDARRLRRQASSFSASASSCTCSNSSSANDKPNFSAMRPSPAAEPGREVAKRDKAWEAIEDHWPLSQSLLISFNILSSSMSSI